MALKTLVFIPTYNERDNAPSMCEEIYKSGVDADLLFVDDNSPDGTGLSLEVLRPRYPRLIVRHRTGKLGIGSAHFEAIQWAYEQGYELVVTMDCDFTHSPHDIPAMIATAEHCDISVGSRWMRSNSLPGWNVFRRGMTWMGHFLTKVVLGIPQDASGAFRAYRLDRLPRQVFGLIKSREYSFFFESLFILNRNGFAIREVPITLPARTYGHSKMSGSAAWRSARYIFELYFANLRRPEQFLLERTPPSIDPTLADPQHWDNYWNDKSDTTGALYELIAGIYRRAIVKSNLERAIRSVFPPGAHLLHAGCGSGQVDTDISKMMKITALDISAGALRLYALNNPNAVLVKHGTIFALPFPDGSFDGVYNLGVMEHFNREELDSILREFYRVLKPGGKIVIFWPHAHASSVYVLKAVHSILRHALQITKKLHPPEISLCQSRADTSALLAKAGFALQDYLLGIRDLFVQAVVVGQK